MMRRIAHGLLLCFVFAIPWEYSLDLGAPLGNVARVAGFLALLAFVPALLEQFQMRRPGLMQWLVLALFLWFCCTCFWSVDAMASFIAIRGFFQEMMLVWLVWELAETPVHLRSLLRAYVGGCWVLAALTIANWASSGSVATPETRFVAAGQDPNDVARYLDLAFPIAALLVGCERQQLRRMLAAGYLPLGLLAVLLTASRSGFLAALVSGVGCAMLLVRGDARRLSEGALLLLVSGCGVALAIPHDTYRRLGTIADELHGGDLNQRWNIWSAGWDAFVEAPWFGRGAGSFVSVAHLAPIDTAHNTILSIGVSGGLCALLLATGIVCVAIASIAQLRGALRLAMGLLLLVWATTLPVATLEESRTTWLTMAVIALAGCLAAENRQALDACFPLRPRAAQSKPIPMAEN